MKELPTPANLHLCATHMYGAEIQACNASGQSLWVRTNIQLEKETDEQNEKTSHQRSKGSGLRIRRKRQRQVGSLNGLSHNTEKRSMLS